MTDGVVTNANGGRQSDSPYFMRGLPPLAILRVARVLKDGAAKYEADPYGDVRSRNWHKITSDEHLEHLMAHVLAYLNGEMSEDHPGHIATRALLFLHQYIAEHPGGKP